MTDTPRRKAEVISTFTDIGTGETFEKDSSHLLEAGRFENYETAGLVRAPVVSVPSTAPKKAAKPKRKATPKKAAPKTATPTPVTTNDAPAPTEVAPIA